MANLSNINNKFIVSDVGHVSIGATTTTYPLTVESGGVGTVLRAGTSFVSIDSVGSAASPSLIFNGDDNTGIWRPAADTLGFSTAGSEKMRLTSGARINMDVMAGHESEGIIRIGRYDANTTRYNEIKSYVSSTAASNYLKLSVHGGVESAVVDVMTLLGNGNVGIGTTSPDGKLDISGAGVSQYITSTSGSQATLFIAVTSGSGRIRLTDH